MTRPGPLFQGNWVSPSASQVRNLTNASWSTFLSPGTLWACSHAFNTNWEVPVALQTLQSIVEPISWLHSVKKNWQATWWRPRFMYSQERCPTKQYPTDDLFCKWRAASGFSGHPSFTHTHTPSPLMPFLCEMNKYSLSPHAIMLLTVKKEREGPGAFPSRYTPTCTHILHTHKSLELKFLKGKAGFSKPILCLCYWKTNGFGSVLLTISNYLPVKAKGNKFPHIQQGYITNRTPASSDGE